MIGVTEKLAKTNALLSDLCARYGRARESVALVAVSKKQPAEAIRAVAQTGHRDIGENYVAEGIDKQRALGDIDGLRWHFIGQLQANKTRAVAEHFDVVHTVARLKIAERLSAQRPHYAPPLEVLIQVNIDDEASKGGVSPDELAVLADAVATLPRLSLSGLMCLPRPSSGLDAQRAPFRRLATLAADLRRRFDLPLAQLSMGMSGDLEAAIAEGATAVRVGTAIFGPSPCMSAEPIIAFVGGGNMAVALISGMLARDETLGIVVAEPAEQQRERLAGRFPGIALTDNNVAAVTAAKLVFLATKPDVLPTVCTELQDAALTLDRTFVSIAAGVRLANLARWLGPARALLRAMPNQPAQVGQGLTALVAAPNVPSTTRERVADLLSGAGDVLWLDDESRMNAITALSGSGPAYFYRLMEILADEARRCGFNADDARRIASATALGAARVAANTTTPLGALREAVTSPGGTTAAALDVLADADIHAIFSAAIDAAIERGKTLDATAGNASDD